MFGIKKNKDKKDKKKKGDIEGMSSQTVKIKIFRELGGSVNTKVGEFFATEKRDSFGGLVIENKGYDFLEDVDFEKEEIFNELQILLKIRNKDKANALKILEKKISHQKKKLNYLDKFIELNALFNYQDEHGMLRNLNVLHNHISNITDGRGAFFTFEDNVRVYSFIKRDGQFHPIWHAVDTYTTYPDFTRKHKIARLETEIFNSEWGEFLKKYGTHASVVLMAIVLGIMICVVGYGGIYVMNKSANLDKIAQASALQCADDYNRITSQMGELIEIEVIGNALNRTIQPEQEEVNNSLKNLYDIKNLVKT